MSKDEFISLIIPVRDRLFRLTQTMLGDRQEAEDTLQDVMIKLWHRHGELDTCRNVEAFAMTVARNACLDKLKSYRHRNVWHSDLIDRTPADTLQPDREMEISQTRQTLDALLMELPEQQRLIFHLRDIEQFAFEEIEEITGMKTGTIRVNLSRARKKVRELYMSRHSKENRG